MAHHSHVSAAAPGHYTPIARWAGGWPPGWLRLAVLVSAIACTLPGHRGWCESLTPASDIIPLTYQTSWIGNTVATPDAWVQMNSETLVVAGDGTCYTNVPWEEGGHNVSYYRVGALIGAALHTHGWGYEGGLAVAVTERYLFISQQVSNEGGGLKSPASWPPKGKTWYGVSRRLRSDPRSAAPWALGKGGDGDTLKGGFLVVLEVDEHGAGPIAGLAADQTTLYASTPSAGTIARFDVQTMEPRGSWAIPGAQQMCSDRDGTLWVVQRIAGAKPQIIHVSQAGELIGPGVGGIASPRGLALDGKGRLYVADDGPDQQIKVITDLTTSPRVSQAIGVPGGIYAAPRGRVAALKFNGPSGVGCDASGNLYVACTGNGFTLECYDPSMSRRWNLEGLEFVDCAAVDPGADANIYTKEEHIVCDWSKPAGHEWRYQGYTLDRFAYPEDARNGHAEFASTWVRRRDGHVIVFGIDMYAEHLLVYRQRAEDEILVPSGMVVKNHIKSAAGAAEWPPHQPAQGEWIWRDGDGDGAFSAGEFEGSGHDAPGIGWGWWVDDRLDVWQVGAQAVRRIPFQGFDPHGNPVWSLAKATLAKVPAPFTACERLIADPAADTMLLAGWSREFPNDKGNWKTTGKVIACYDHWSSSPSKRWEIHPPYDIAAEHSTSRGTTVAMASAGDYLFVVYLISAEVRVHKLGDGAYVGSLVPAKDLSGWVDLPYGITASRRADGEYLVIVEEDAKAKNIVYRWKPPGH